MSVFMQLSLVVIFLLYSAAYLVAIAWLADRAASPAPRRPHLLPATLALAALPLLGGLLALLV